MTLEESFIIDRLRGHPKGTSQFMAAMDSRHPQWRECFINPYSGDLYPWFFEEDSKPGQTGSFLMYREVSDLLDQEAGGPLDWVSIFDAVGSSI